MSWQATGPIPRRPIRGSDAGRAGSWVRPHCRWKKKWRAPQDAPKVAFGNKQSLDEPRQIDKPQERMTTSGWKGLDTGRMPVFLGYDQTERMIAALLDRAEQWQPDYVVGIARGGLV